ncbi:MAG: GxxExxY protein [Gammaproteobacteria bacterium]
MTENEIGDQIVKLAIRVHRKLGPGLLESVYEAVLAWELRRVGLEVQRQLPISIAYENLKFEEGFRADLLVHEKVIIELKCVDRLNYGHQKQVLTYLRLSGKRVGYLLNFSAGLMRDGIIRIVDGLPEGD